MLTIKDKVEQFKRDCKSNDYYTKAVMDINEKIEEYDVILTGLSSPGFGTEPKCENARNPYATNKLEIVMKQDELIKERDEYIRRINDVNSKLMKIVDPIDRQMVIDTLINKEHYSVVSSKYRYNDYSALRKHINSVIKKII